MKKLEKGMFVKILSDMTIYDPNTFEPIIIKEGSHGEIEYVGFGVMTDKAHPPYPLISIRFKEGGVVIAGDKVDEFNKTFEVI